MNSKAIRKQLLAAVAMVLVAAVALGSSTYAWFVASGTVEATGMSVKAQSEGGLVIRYHGGKWRTVADAGMTTARQMTPASTIDLNTWYTSEADDPDRYVANLATVSTVNLSYTTGTDDSDVGQNCYDSKYALVKWFDIRSATKDNAPMGLKVSEIDVPSTKNMSTALRVGVKCTYKNPAWTDGGSEPKTLTTTHIYAPVDDSGENVPSKNYAYIVPNPSKADGENDYVYSNDTVKFTESARKTFTVNTIGDPIIPANVEITSDEVVVYIYVWFEGEDHNLYSNNFNAENLNVSVSFTSITTA